MPDEDVLERNRTIGRSYVDCINAAELDPAFFATEGFVYNNPQGQQTDFAGAAGTLKYFESAFPDHHTTTYEEIVTPDRAVYRWITRGSHQGEMMGIPPSGKPIELRGMTILRIEDGKIHEVWENIDLLGLMQQMGAIPSPDQAPAGATA
jgi:steroid delta-isomerase-like uncharacterized protein